MISIPSTPIWIAEDIIIVSFENISLKNSLQKTEIVKALRF